MKLNIIGHELMLKNDELICADGQNPRHRPLVDRNEVSLHINRIPYAGGVRQELMATYQSQVMELSLCDVCYEAIIIELISPRAQVIIGTPKPAGNTPAELITLDCPDSLKTIAAHLQHGWDQGHHVAKVETYDFTLVIDRNRDRRGRYKLRSPQR